MHRSLIAIDLSTHDNGLSALAGTWSNTDFEEFERATAVFRLTDDWSSLDSRP